MPASLAPDTNDLNVASPHAFEVADARVQQFYEVLETGGAVFDASALSLRYDGSGRTAPAGATMTIAQLTIRIGVTALGVDRLGANLDANLTAPLVTAYSGTQIVLPCDTTQAGGVEQWGGPGGALRFPFNSRLQLQVPPGGSLVVELLIQGNSNAGGHPAALDFAFDASGIVPGASVLNGRGCPAAPGASGTTMRTVGQYEPGTAFRIVGDGYPPNAPVATLITANLLQNQLALPLTNPICWVYVDAMTGPALAGGVTNGNGDLVPTDTSPAVPLPKSPQLCGMILYVQTAAPTATFAGNSFGVVTSNYRTVVIGCSNPPRVRGWHAVSTLSAQGRVATVAVPGGIAMRLE